MPTATGYLLAQGSFNLTTNAAGNPASVGSLGAGDDVLGGAIPANNLDGSVNFHGGYAESYKSKIIIPKFLTALYEDDAGCDAATTAVVDIQIPNNCIECDGSTSLRNQIRLDFKGNAVLRYLNRFAYSTYYIKDCCADMSGQIPGAAVATEFAAQINADPIVNPFVTASTHTGNQGNNILRLTVGYTPTFFDNCSFDTRDNVDHEPLTMKVGVLDEDGDVCVDSCLTQRKGTSAAFAKFPTNQTVNVVLAKTEKTGENVLRDLILDRRYSQDGGHNQGNRDSARFREIEKGNNILAAVDRTKFYRNYKIQHTVPRFNNPTGVFDNDQYLYEIHVECGSGGNTLWSDISKFITGLHLEAKAAGRFVPIQTI